MNIIARIVTSLCLAGIVWLGMDSPAQAQDQAIQAMLDVQEMRRVNREGAIMRLWDEWNMAYDLGLLNPGIRPPSTDVYTSIDVFSTMRGNSIVMTIGAQGIESVGFDELQSGAHIGWTWLSRSSDGNGGYFSRHVDGSMTMELQSLSNPEQSVYTGPCSWWSESLEVLPFLPPPYTTLGAGLMAIGMDDHWQLLEGSEWFSFEAQIDNSVINEVILDAAGPDPYDLPQLVAEERIAMEQALELAGYSATEFTGGSRSGDAFLVFALAEGVSSLDYEQLLEGAELGILFVNGLSDRPEPTISAGFYRVNVDSVDGSNLRMTFNDMTTGEVVFESDASFTQTINSAALGEAATLSFTTQGYSIGAQWVSGENVSSVSASISAIVRET